LREEAIHIIAVEAQQRTLGDDSEEKIDRFCEEGFQQGL